MSKATWHRVTDVKAWLNDRGQKKVGPHQMTGKVLHWTYCSRCGLVALKNDATRRELRKLCVTWE